MNNFKKPGTKDLRNFGFLIGFGFPIIIGWLFPFISGHSFRQWTIMVSIPAIILSITKPKLLLHIYALWMRLGYYLGWINSRIILGIIFLFVLQPIAFAMNLFGYDPLRKKKESTDTYRELKKNQKIDLKRIF